MIDPLVVRDFLTDLQTRLVTAAESIEGEDGARFRLDPWQKAASEALTGSGCTCIIEGGAVFERGGVAFSHVRGPALPPSATARRPELAGRAFEAMGVSSVFHPINPYCPTAHMNVRALLATSSSGEPAWWFGGGMDLTPYYPVLEDIRHFHTVCKNALQGFGDDRDFRRAKQLLTALAHVQPS
jgi:coproporphyrinogen III oxidase